LIALISITLAACLPVKPQSNQSAGGDYEEFFLGSNSYQYFIKPLSFSANEADIKLDITFRYPDIRDTAAVNFTLITKKPQSRISKLQLSNHNHTSELTELEIIFTESESEYQARYTGGLVTEEIIQLLSDPNWTLSLTYREGGEKFKPTRRTQRVLSRLESGLYSRLSDSEEHFFTD